MHQTQYTQHKTNKPYIQKAQIIIKKTQIINTSQNTQKCNISQLKHKAENKNMNIQTYTKNIFIYNKHKITAKIHKNKNTEITI